MEGRGRRERKQRERGRERERQMTESCVNILSLFSLHFFFTASTAAVAREALPQSSACICVSEFAHMCVCGCVCGCVDAGGCADTPPRERVPLSLPLSVTRTLIYHTHTYTHTHTHTYTHTYTTLSQFLFARFSLCAAQTLEISVSATRALPPALQWDRRPLPPEYSTARTLSSRT